MAQRWPGFGAKRQKPGQAELRQRIQINRAKRLANAKNSPLSQTSLPIFLKQTLPGYAAMLALAAMIVLTGSSLAYQNRDDTKLAQTAPAPTVASQRTTTANLSKIESP
ncbi:MAG: hypothetical protein ACR2OM_11740 [Aestuariivirgaceae bacterium]